MTDMNILEDLLSRVVLWDVKGETSNFITMSHIDNVKEEVQYLRQHGYNASIYGDEYLGLIQILVKKGA